MRHLFADDVLITRTWRLRRRFHQPRKHGEPVLRPEMPWESNRLHLWSSPIYDSKHGVWRMWYYASDDLLPLHAVSEDGITWERRETGLAEPRTSQANNLVHLGFPGEGKENRLVVVHDPGNEQAPFKALTRIQGSLQPLLSRDGLRWELHQQCGIPSNDEYRLGHDETAGKFIATVKLGGIDGRGPAPVAELGRSVCLSVSEDFVTWSAPQPIFHSDQRDDEMGAQMIAQMLADPRMRSPQVRLPEQYRTDVYNMPVFRYEDTYFGLPVMFHQSGAYRSRPQTDPSATNQDGILYPQLVSSRELLHWQRTVERHPFISLSPCASEEIIDNGMIHCTAPQRVGDELRFYYSGARYTHISSEALVSMGLMNDPEKVLGAVFLATLRVDGFVSMRADQQVGALLTEPLQVEGSRLYVNADACAGELRVEIRDAATGRAIPGYSMGDSIAASTGDCGDGTQAPLRGGLGARFPDDPSEDTTVPLTSDAVRAQVTWQDGSDLSALRGRQVRLFFVLRNADLYSFWYEQ